MDEHGVMQDRVSSALLSVNRMYLKLAYESSGMSAIRFAEDVLMPVLDQLGTRWVAGELSLSQIYMSGRLCEALMDEAFQVDDSNTEQRLTIAVAVLEDFHVLGKRIVCSVLRAGGYRFLDYGPITLDELVAKVRQDEVRILLVSTLMLASALRVTLLREHLDQLPWRVRLIVGGAPFRFDPELWRQVGADATSPTASGVVGLIETMNQEVGHV